jgi:hypothetical protein
LNVSIGQASSPGSLAIFASSIPNYRRGRYRSPDKRQQAVDTSIAMHPQREVFSPQRSMISQTACVCSTDERYGPEG